MKSTDAQNFALLIAGVYAYHRQPCSDALIGMYWRGCQRWDYEQVVKAIDRLTNDAEAGKFPPKIGDLTRVLEGTHTDRAQLAWGKALEAMGSVGAYTDVVFDDPAIHATIEDMGGWPKLCRTESKELGYLQHRFCEAHKAYTGRGDFEYPRRLMGDRSPDHEYQKHGVSLPKPALIGDVERCKTVYQGGNLAGKTAISYSAIDALVLDNLMPRIAA
ncbi:DUF6475 domain-containing protein [Variovorax sp. J22R193]|uniref:DUF6475 domain-containing protein n=1 Tax=Variovorax fucosicus TaxID=3053517 RepID=UPI0025758A27|nr:DUF6475 domain-containing protein [Variovorax sp. J22R193]MDM0041855.1 DUF6475 domain-containing protein [Variovorax sp. J22R193]